MEYYLIIFIFIILAGGVLINSFCKDHNNDQE